jgi:hypothetical protein
MGTLRCCSFSSTYQSVKQDRDSYAVEKASRPRLAFAVAYDMGSDPLAAPQASRLPRRDHVEEHEDRQAHAVRLHARAQTHP